MPRWQTCSRYQSAIHTEDRAHEADHPTLAGGEVRHGPAAEARLRHRSRAVPDRLPDLWRTQCRSLQRHSGLPCADRRPACRQCASDDRQARLVGDHGRSRPPARYRPILHHLLERDRRLHGLDRPGLDQSRDRQGVGAGFSDHHHSRHGARADHADRSSRHRHAVLRGRRLDGRHAGAAMDGGLSGTGVLALAIACSTRHSAQNIAFHELGRQAVMADPEWHHGRYFEQGTHPHRGLGVARMAAHITYLSDAALHRKFGRRMQDRDLPTFSFDADFQVESYLRYQGSSFVERFDANSYLYLTRAMDYFDIAADHDGVLAQAFRGIKTRFCVVSFTSDWLFPTAESRALVHALNASSARVSFAEIETDRGHDAFLLDVPEFFDISRAFLRIRRQGARAGRRRSMSMQQQVSAAPGVAAPRHRALSQRSPAGRGDGGARLQGARCRLRRGRSAATAGDARYRRPRHRIVARGRQSLRRQGARGGAGRRRHRPDQLSR